MLIGLEIKNFVIVSNLSIEWYNGMIVIIGEIGVGKLIVIDVLLLCFGEWVDVVVVCLGFECVEICVEFDIS